MKEEYFKTADTNTVYKTVEYEDGSMKPFVFQHISNEWVNVSIGILTQAQWNGWGITKEEADKIIKEQIEKK